MSKTKAPGDIPVHVFASLDFAQKTALASLVGVTYRTVSYWATGDYKPSPLALESVRKALKRMGVDA